MLMSVEDQEWLRVWTDDGRRHFAEHHGLQGDFWRGATISSEDARGLRRAAEAGLAQLADHGSVLVTRFRSQKRYRMYLHYDGGAVRPGRAWTWSWQEMFCQISFAAELVLDHGWRPEQVELEVDRLDVAAGDDPVRRPYLLAEAKLTDGGTAGLAAMLEVFDELAGGLPAAVSRQVRKNALPKYEGLLRLRPTTFVAVAPGIRHWFTVNYPTETRVVLHPASPSGQP